MRARSVVVAVICAVGGLSIALLLTVGAHWANRRSGPPLPAMQAEAAVGVSDVDVVPSLPTPTPTPSMAPPVSLPEAPGATSESERADPMAARRAPEALPARFPTEIALDKLRASSQSHLRISEDQRIEIDTALTDFRMRSGPALSGLDRERMALSRRLMRLDGDGKEAGDARRKLADLDRRRRAQTAVLDEELFQQLSQILTGPQIETLRQETEAARADEDPETASTGMRGDGAASPIP